MLVASSMDTIFFEQSDGHDLDLAFVDHALAGTSRFIANPLVDQAWSTAVPHNPELQSVLGCRGSRPAAVSYNNLHCAGD